jgi:5-(hydroxymethyl)furfural/furfural oxidase
VADALAARGVPLRADMNGEYDEGIYPFPLNNSVQSRLSAAMAYLTAEVRARPNLTVRGRTRVEQILMERGHVRGVRAKGLQARADYHAPEVVMTAGTLQSPVLLMQSGIGDADQLASLGIDVHAHVPGVGANLHDHPFVSIAGYLRRHARQPKGLRSPTCIVVRRSSRTADGMACDQFLGVAGKVSWHAFGERVAAMNVVLYGPRSRGAIRLNGSPTGPVPSIEFNLLQDPSDLERLKEGFHFVHGIVTSAQVRPLLHAVFAASFTPRMLRANRQTLRNRMQAAALTAVMDMAGSSRATLLRRLVSSAPLFERLIYDDALLDAWLRQNATGFFHPVGTCRMGADTDPLAVVDPSGRVRGIGGLLVADASVMPTIPRAPTNLTTLMIAEKIAATMRGDRTPASTHKPDLTVKHH